jgi:hypothetical protein
LGALNFLLIKIDAGDESIMAIASHQATIVAIGAKEVETMWRRDQAIQTALQEGGEQRLFMPLVDEMGAWRAK